MTVDEVPESEWVEVTVDAAADWLVRSALPAFCDLGGMFSEDAAWLRRLEPYRGHTLSGRLQGWPGVGKRVLSVESRLSVAYATVLREARDAGRPIRAVEDLSIDAETLQQVREVAVFARRQMLPSRVGLDAYRVLGRIPRFVAAAGQLYGMGTEASNGIAAAWQNAWTAMNDRAVLGQLVNGERTVR